MKQQIEPGQEAPDFSLYDSDKVKITLSQFRGQPVLLLFFPAAFTSTCTKELCSVRDNIAMYNAINARVFGISVDSVYALGRYKNEQKLNFSLLSDFNKEVSTKYGCLYDLFNYDMRGVSKRSAFVIDRNGAICYVEVLENASDIPDFQRIGAALQLAG